jgi:hypothetical protein
MSRTHCRITDLKIQEPRRRVEPGKVLQPLRLAAGVARQPLRLSTERRRDLVEQRLDRAG